jgi:hypothetical protein
MILGSKVNFSRHHHGFHKNAGIFGSIDISARCVIQCSSIDIVWYQCSSIDIVWYHVLLYWHCVIPCAPLLTLCDTSALLLTLCDTSAPPLTSCDTSAPPLTSCDTSAPLLTCVNLIDLSFSLRRKLKVGIRTRGTGLISCLTQTNKSLLHSPLAKVTDAYPSMLIYSALWYHLSFYRDSGREVTTFLHIAKHSHALSYNCGTSALSPSGVVQCHPRTRQVISNLHSARRMRSSTYTEPAQQCSMLDNTPKACSKWGCKSVNECFKVSIHAIKHNGWLQIY